MEVEDCQMPPLDSGDKMRKKSGFCGYSGVVK